MLLTKAVSAKAILVFINLMILSFHSPVFGQIRIESKYQQSGTDVRLIAVHAVNETEVWAAGLKGTFVKTLDGGKTWTPSQVEGASELEFRDVHAFGNGMAYLLSAGPGDKSRIYQTLNGGETWQLQFMNQIPEAFFDCMSFWDSKSGLAFSDSVDGSLLVIRTFDGRVWEPISSDQIPPSLPGEGSFAASGTCLVTEGNGQAWIGTGAAATARVFRTQDKGNNWTVADTPIKAGKTAGIASIGFVDSKQVFAFGGDVVETSQTGSNLSTSKDGGKTWSVMDSNQLPTVYGAKAVSFRGRIILITVGPKGTYFSTDEGISWQTVNQDNYWGITFSKQGIGWIVGPEGKISRLTIELKKQ